MHGSHCDLHVTTLRAVLQTAQTSPPFRPDLHPGSSCLQYSAYSHHDRLGATGDTLQCSPQTPQDTVIRIVKTTSDNSGTDVPAWDPRAPCPSLTLGLGCACLWRAGVRAYEGLLHSPRNRKVGAASGLNNTITCGITGT